jgi:hypothetical protein
VLASFALFLAPLLVLGVSVASPSVATLTSLTARLPSVENDDSASAAIFEKDSPTAGVAQPIGYLVDYKPGVRPVNRDGSPLMPEELRSFGLEFGAGSAGYSVLEVDSPREELLLYLDDFKGEAYVEKVSINYAYSLGATELRISSSAGTQKSLKNWGLDRIDQISPSLDGSYSYAFSGREIRIYVVDSGVDNHPDLAGRIASGWSAIRFSSNTDDCQGHGTHAAGIAAGTDYGVAKQATIVPVQVLDCNGSGSTASLASGLQWILDNHPDGEPGVVNLSLGGFVPAGSALGADELLIKELNDRGLVVVVAAGNEAYPVCGEGWGYPYDVAPARVDEAVTVQASTKQDTWADFTNWGSCTDIFAPGVAITSARFNSSRAVSYSGTSMAAPFVAGALARIFERNTGFTSAEAKSELYSNSIGKTVGETALGDPSRLLFAPQPEEFGSPSVSLSEGRTVGTPIVLSPGDWVEGASLSISWFRTKGRNRGQIYGETGESYTPDSADVGYQIYATVSASRPGYLSTSVQSELTESIQSASYTSTEVPTVSGSAVLGLTLTASVADWDPVPDRYAYQWLSNGKPIKRATGSTYVPGKKDVGKRISVRVAVVKSGYVTATETSTSTDSVSR